MFVYVMFSICLHTHPHGRLTFDTLSHIAAYAQTLPESVTSESPDEFNPVFDQFNKTRRIGYGTRLLSLFGFKPYVDSNDFINSIKRVTRERELDGKFGDFVCKEYITDNTNWFMWGSLYGAFHTFVRTLQYLKEAHVIDDTLRIIQADTYFVFADTLQSYTPYGLETLWVLLTLLEQNTDKVFVLKTMSAQLEDSKRYNILSGFSLRFAQPIGMLEQLLSKFSNTLPLALYLIGKDNNIVRISALHDISMLNDTHWSYFFEDSVGGCCKIKDIELSDEKVRFASSIHLYHEIPIGRKISRLSHAQENGAYVWKLFSTPIEPFKSVFRFHYDAFVELVTEKYFSNWQLSVWSHDLDKTSGFEKVRSFNVESGKIVFSINPQERIDFLEQQIAIAQAKEQEIKQECAYKESMSLIEK